MMAGTLIGNFTRQSSFIPRPTKVYCPLFLQCCFASKKSGGSSRNQGKHNTSKRRYVIVVDGQMVKPGSILVRQLGFKYHPGRNVSYGRDHSLYALVEGHVKFQKELLEVRPKSPMWKDNPNQERTFIHIIEKMKPRKLVCVNNEQFLNDLEHASSQQSTNS